MAGTKCSGTSSAASTTYGTTATQCTGFTPTALPTAAPTTSPTTPTTNQDTVAPTKFPTVRDLLLVIIMFLSEY